tara:strand:- start:4440 stop:4895 length:456 start_codon:yes stop_codon:yes gene_type:complete
MEKTLKCGSCGASFDKPPFKQTLCKCRYCGSITIFDGLKDSSEGVTRDIIPQITINNVKYSKGLTADIGNLTLTKTEVVFIPNSFNWNSNYQLVFSLNEIKNILEEDKMFGMFKWFTFVMENNDASTFVSDDRDSFLFSVRTELDKATKSL